MFKTLKISKKPKSRKAEGELLRKRKKQSKHLASIKLSRRSSFGSMFQELSSLLVEEQLQELGGWHLH